MKVVVTGATGFIGRALCRLLTTEGHTVTTLGRNANRARQVLERDAGQYLAWDNEGAWRPVVAEADAVFHLAGASVGEQRWTPEVKEELRASRVDTTRRIAEAAPRVLVSASAIGYYGDTGEKSVDETALPGNDFLAQLCQAWEAETLQAEALHESRVVLARIGIVLGRGGGPLEAVLQPPGMAFSPWKMGLGGPLGNGKQWFSWVHLDDVCRLLLWAAEKPTFSGALNVVAPNPVRNAEFTATLGKALGKPSVLPIPGFALRAMIGEFAYALLYSQRVVPTAARAGGYTFRYTHLDNALRDLIQ
jgi:uncharacterized protein (TIGR01777 family)